MVSGARPWRQYKGQKEGFDQSPEVMKAGRRISNDKKKVEAGASLRAILHRRSMEMKHQILGEGSRPHSSPFFTARSLGRQARVNGINPTVGLIDSP
jgi:hypothetical protein